jgi:hypothetical protein
MGRLTGRIVEDFHVPVLCVTCSPGAKYILQIQTRDAVGERQSEKGKSDDRDGDGT